MLVVTWTSKTEGTSGCGVISEWAVVRAEDRGPGRWER